MKIVCTSVNIFAKNNNGGEREYLKNVLFKISLEKMKMLAQGQRHTALSKNRIHVIWFASFAKIKPKLPKYIWDVYILDCYIIIFLFTEFQRRRIW